MAQTMEHQKYSKKNIRKKKSLYKIIFHKTNLGKGAAIKSATKYIKGTYVGIQDADLEYNPKDLVKIYNYINKNKFFAVYGSRVLNKNKYQNTNNFTHLIRIWANYLLTVISNFINSQNLTDAHTCYKVLKSNLFKNLNLKENGFAFCPEVNTKLSKKKINIIEIPISYNDGKKISTLDGLIALFCLIKYRIIS